MAQQLIVTGGHGFVAGSVITQAGSEWEVHVFSRGPARPTREGVSWHTLDLLNPEQLSETVERIGPAAVIHTAAIPDIDYSEAHPKEAVQANVETTRNLARACKNIGARLVFTSTDNVFDGESGPYSEASPVNPINHYGRTKVEAERVIEETIENAAIARVALVMGLPILGTGNSFLSRMLVCFEAGETVGVPANEIRSPIDVITLGRALLELAGNRFVGPIQLGGLDGLPRVDMVRRIALALGYADELVEPNDPTGIPGRADRPRDLIFDCVLAGKVLSTPLQGIEGGLTLVMEETERLKGSVASNQ